MPTKQEIIESLSLLPLATLERLHEYSQYLIIPEKDMLSAVTMRQLVDKGKELADKHFPDWDYDSPSDFGRFLLELISVFGEQRFWYLSTYASQSLFRKMSVYSVAFGRAVELGYVPQVQTASRASFTLNYAAGSSQDYAPGDLILKTADGYKYTNLDTFNIPTSVSAGTLSVQLHEGNLFSETYTFDGSNIFIGKRNIDPASIKIFIDSVEWARVNNFGQSSGSSTHFMVLPESDGAVSIYFGEDNYGKTPAAGTLMTIRYLTCTGASSNKATSSISVDKSLSDRPVSSATQNAASTLGADQDSLATLKNTTLSYFTGKNALINSFAVESFLNAQPDIFRSKCSVLGNIATFYVQPIDGSVAGAPLLTDLESRISPLLMAGFMAAGATTSYESIGLVNIDLYILEDSDYDYIEAQAKQLISDYSDPLVLASYGKDFDLTELTIFLVSKLTGVQNVVFNTPSTSIAVGNNSLMQKIDIADITINRIIVR